MSQVNELITRLQGLLDQKVQEYTILYDVLQTTKAEIQGQEEEIQRLRNAIQALTGNYSYSGSNAEDKVVETATYTDPSGDSRIPVKAVSGVSGVSAHAAPGPECRACGGTVQYTERTLDNGRKYYLWVCKDSGCNNEQF